MNYKVRVFLKIKNGVGCNSRIGKLKDEKPQIVNLDRRFCMNQATIAHELVHALGFDHEHNRPDRDDWIKINFNNVIKGESNIDFKILNQTQFKDLGTPYNYESIMHYHHSAHSMNSSSITTILNILLRSSEIANKTKKLNRYSL